MLYVGVFRDGKLLFRLANGVKFKTYEQASVICMLFESFNLPLEDGDYIACDYEEVL